MEYDYTIKDTNLLTNGNVFSYLYPATAWRDQLLEYNGQKFEYDNLGNPTLYRDKTLSWSHNRQLDNFDNIRFTYNSSGIRTSKTVNGTKTNFYLDGTKILAQSNGNMLLFKYGNEGVIGFTYQGVGEYYYKKNILGDIIGIIDNNGIEIAKYVYDAWGNHKTYVLNNNTYIDINDKITYTENGLNNKVIAELNPFRYRSYYYDSETNLYYLNSRYYDPELGRFINADDFSILEEGKDFFNGLNLYAYCGNNPVMNTDETGNAWWHWLISIASIVVGAILVATGVGSVLGGALITAGASSIISGSINKANGGSFEAGWTGGLITGFLCGIGTGLGGLLLGASTTIAGLGSIGLAITSYLVSFSFGFGASILGSFVTSCMNNKEFDINSILHQSLLAGGLNIFAGIASSITSAIKDAATPIVNKILSVSVTLISEYLLDFTSFITQKIFN